MISIKEKRSAAADFFYCVKPACAVMKFLYFLCRICRKDYFQTAEIMDPNPVKNMDNSLYYQLKRFIINVSVLE